MYWYGADMSQAYSLIAKSKIISYEEGVRRGFHEIPKDIKRKLRKRKKLFRKEKLVVHNRKAAEDDSTLPPSERSLWLMDFKEEFEEEDSQEDDEDDDEDSSLEGGSDESENDYNSNNNIRITRSKKNFLLHSPTSDDDRCQPLLHAELQVDGNKRRRSHHSSPNNEKKRSSLSPNNTKCFNKNSSKKAKKDHENLTDAVDLRVLLKPVRMDTLNKKIKHSDHDGSNDDGDDSDDNDSKKYNLQILQNGAIISESELQFSGDEPVTQQLKNQNITLNLAFKL